jgi:hypothetical protein
MKKLTADLFTTEILTFNSLRRFGTFAAAFRALTVAIFAACAASCSEFSTALILLSLLPSKVTSKEKNTQAHTHEINEGDII